MARFYGSVQGNRGMVHRLGSATSGLHVVAAGHRGAIMVRTWVGRDGEDMCEVSLTPWQVSGGEIKVLYRGKLDAKAP